MAAAYHGLEACQYPQATSGVNVMQRLGASFGTALLAVILQQGISGASARDASGGESNPTHLLNAFNDAFLWTIAFALIALVPALMLPGRAKAASKSQATREPQTAIKRN